ncbi:Uncharacterised protein [Helicobacter fennelliae]|uniref:Uncharacterized protein n=1 Tax=Helicobacter fennelliae TaxID=215 RepID=A0A2X3EM74_9HELI|nr:hypothetical protein [Helicobacter fennelliae]SQC36454.1 Uncharacterised protein [Helicobacter fennelliae]
MKSLIQVLFIISFFCITIQAKDYKVECQKCVISISLSDRELEEIHKRYKNEDDINSVASDINYYTYIIESYAEEFNIKIIPLDSNEYSNLIFVDKKITIDGRSFWLYQKGKKPYKLMDISAPQDEINTYFNITNPKYPKENE